MTLPQLPAHIAVDGETAARWRRIHETRGDRTRPGAGAVRSGLAPVDEPRVYLAAERTFLAWVRTSLALMGFGFVIARFALFLRELGMVEGERPQSRTMVSPALGFVMVCLGVIVIVVAAFRHMDYIHALERAYQNPPLRSSGYR